MDNKKSLCWENTYTRLLSSFNPKVREYIETTIEKALSKGGTHRIMDQGCGQANSIREIIERFWLKYPENRFEGYGVSASLEDMSLAAGTNSKEEIGFEEENKNRNYCFNGIEEDVHQIMKCFPHPLDLVFSDKTYFHLVAPWLALKRTVDKLALGGVGIFGTLFPARVWGSALIELKDDILLYYLAKDNHRGYSLLSSGQNQSRCGHSVLAITKRKEVPFKTNMHLGMLWRGEKHFGIHPVYSREARYKDLLAVDEL